jgi:hypothetical protein
VRVYDLSPPPPPVFQLPSRSASGVLLSWTAQKPVRVRVRRQEPNRLWRVVSPWLPIDRTFFLDESAAASTPYRYRLEARSPAGVAALTSAEVAVTS